MPSRFGKVYTKKLYLPDGKLKGQSNKMARVTATPTELNINDGLTASTAEINELDGAVMKVGDVTSTAAEVNLLDGAVVANSVASIVPVLGADKTLRTGGNNGVAGTGVTAVEYGDGIHHMTHLTFANTVTFDDPAGANDLGDGRVIYTFPATGDIVVKDMTMAAGLFGTGNAADVPEIGIGSVVAAGAITGLNSTAGFEDYITGTGATAADGVADAVLTAEATATGHTILTKGAHVLNLNACCPGTWTGADATMYFTGALWISWNIRIY